MTGPDAKAPGKRVLLLLATASVLNFLDRNIIGILALPIRTEFNLSDTALGTVGVFSMYRLKTSTHTTVISTMISQENTLPTQVLRASIACRKP